jgi:hypothetical protein
VTQPKLSRPVPEEFVRKVNDFLEAANRIERRRDSAHAQMVLLHAFARYGAHHYLTVVKEDSASEREICATYMGEAIARLLKDNIEQMRGPAPDAGEPAAE